MAFYVKLEKQTETATKATYSFWSTADNVGSLEIAKSSGEILLVKPVSGDDQGRLFLRAAAKLKREWHEGRLPEMTEWAS